MINFLNLEDKQDDEEFVKQRLNQRLIQKMKEIHLLRMKEVTEQQKAEKEKEKKDKEQGRKKKLENMRTDATLNFKSKLGDQEREIHEAYQILLAETIRRRNQRKKQARIRAAREKDHAESLAKRVSELNTKKDSHTTTKVSFRFVLRLRQM